MSTQWKNKRGWYSQYLKVRTRLLENNRLNNGGRCHLQIEGVCTGKAEQIHHVLGIGRNKLDPNYMVPACAPCNQRVGDPEVHSPPHTPTTALD